MEIPEIVKYPKYLINTELLSWAGIHKDFKKLQGAKDSEDEVAELQRECPFYTEETFPEFSKNHGMNLTFWEQRVLLGILALFTVKSFTSSDLHTSWYKLYKTCFIKETQKKGRTILSRGDRGRVRESLDTLQKKKEILFTRSRRDKEDIFHYNPYVTSILSAVEIPGMGLVISLNLYPDDFDRETQNNYYSIPSNIFTYLKSGSHYSPLFIKWLARQNSKRTTVVIKRKNLIKILKMEKYYKTNRKWAEKTLFTAYQEAKDAGILLDWKEKGEQDVFYLKK